MKEFIYLIFSLFTAVVGHKIHGSIFWAIIDFIFVPLVWLKWLLFQEVSVTVIKEAFSFFVN